MHLYSCLAVFVISLLTSLTAAALPNAVGRSRVSCPCTILIGAPHDAPPLHIIVGRSLTRHRLLPSLRSDAIRTDMKLSRNAWRPSQATTRDALFAYHAVRVDMPARISLYVARAHDEKTHSIVSTTTSFSLGSQIRFHIATGAKQNTQCPVILNPGNSARDSVSHSQVKQVAQPRIVGGQRADSKLAEHLAFIVTPSAQGSRACSGTVVASNLVITAAHCEVNRNSDIYVGGQRGNPADGIRRGVASVSQHQSFFSANRFRYDIAVVTLDQAIPASAAPMKVNINESVPVEGSVVRAAGYGLRQHDSPNSNVDSVLYFVDIPVVPGPTCARAYEPVQGVEIDYNFQVCAGYFGIGGCDSCQGDSGGPLLQYDDEGDPVLVGVVSIGVECANPDYPGVYVRTASHNEFLPQEGIQRTQATVAIFSDFKPTTPFPRRIVILAAAGGAAVVASVALALLIVHTNRRRRRTQLTSLTTSVPPIMPPPTMPPPTQPILAPPPPVYNVGNAPPSHTSNGPSSWPDLPPPDAHLSHDEHAAYRWSLYAASAGQSTNSAFQTSQPQETQASTNTTETSGTAANASNDSISSGNGNSVLALETYDPYQGQRGLAVDPNAVATNNASEPTVNTAATSDTKGGTS